MIRSIYTLVIGLFTPSIAKALAGVTDAITMLDKAIDYETANMERFAEERRVLAARRNDLLANESMAEIRREQASRVRTKLQDLIA